MDGSAGFRVADEILGAAGADEAWELTDHCCRACLGRLMARTDDGRRMARCSECGIEATGGVATLCWCGADTGATKVRLRCMPNAAPSPDCPVAVMVEEIAASAAYEEPRCFQIDGFPKTMFRCNVLKATMSVDACAANWRRAPTLKADQITGTHQCRDCPIGATHAGEHHVFRSPIFGSSLCPRCRRGGARMVGDRLCISDYNRQLEFRKQRNGKGTVPQFRFDRRRVGVIIKGAYVELSDDYTVDAVELALQVLRTVPARVAFVRPRGEPAITSAELMRRYRDKPAHGSHRFSREKRRRAALELIA